jgi:hypothetical protein
MLSRGGEDGRGDVFKKGAAPHEHLTLALPAPAVTIIPSLRRR